LTFGQLSGIPEQLVDTNSPTSHKIESRCRRGLAYLLNFVETLQCAKIQKRGTESV